MKETGYHLKIDFRSPVCSFFTHEPCERLQKSRVRSRAVHSGWIVIRMKEASGYPPASGGWRAQP